MGFSGRLHISAKNIQLNTQTVLIENLNTVVKLVEGNGVFYKKGQIIYKSSFFNSFDRIYFIA